MPPESDRLAKIPTHSLAEQARTLIRNAIFEGKIKPEERLTIERIAGELGISRTPVREALKLLEADGIIRMLPNRGAVVQRFDPDELIERYSLRALLEGYAAEMACRAQGPKLALVLEANCRKMGEEIHRLDALDGTDADDLDQIGKLLELNRQFHHAILVASQCTLVGRQLDALQMPLAYRLYQWRAPMRRMAVLTHHMLITDTFRNNHPKRARKAVEAHISDVRDYIISTARP